MNGAGPSAGEAALVGVSGRDSEGIVLLHDGLQTWSSICSTQWDDVDATVLCKQLGYPAGTSVSYR